ncbi:hypothetical protein ABFS83_07G101600 [Erythranthe nasuta]
MNRKVRGVEEDLDEFLDFVVKEHLKGGGIRGNEKDFVDVLLDIRRNDEGGFVLEESSIKALVLVARVEKIWICVKVMDLLFIENFLLKLLLDVNLYLKSAMLMKCMHV